MVFVARGRTRGFLSVYGESLLPRITKFITEGLTGRLQMSIRSSKGKLDVYLELLNGFPVICVAVQASRPIVGIDCLDILTKIECIDCLVEVLELAPHEVDIDIDYVKSYYGQNAIISKEQAHSFVEKAKRLAEQLSKQTVQRDIRETMVQPMFKPAKELSKPEKKPIVQPRLKSERREAREEVKRRGREKEEAAKGIEDKRKELKVKVEHVREEKKYATEVMIIDSIDDISKEILSPLLLVKLLTSMEFISGFTGSANEFFKQFCERSKSIPEAVYIARIRVGSKVYRVAAVGGKLVAAVVEGEEHEIYGRKALEILSKEKTIVASIARVPIDMLPDDVREKIVAKGYLTKHRDKNYQESQDLHRLAQGREEVNK
ncbi:MAG TPA: hypothetical protein EYH26_02795 [Pyrodictium sp.]|nr:hypothetical protein [Pyrodictium sp.]